jgi:hypothetical protein
MLKPTFSAMTHTVSALVSWSEHREMIGWCWDIWGSIHAGGWTHQFDFHFDTNGLITDQILTTFAFACAADATLFELTWC